MDVDVVRDTAALDALSADWTRLDAADPGAEFYTRFPVVRAWWAAFGEDAAYDLEVVVARHNGAVVGILPLARQRISVRRQPRTQLRFASHGDWMGVILDPSLNPRTVCRALLAALDADPSWDILSLDNLRAGSALAATALATDRWNPHLTHRVEHPWIDLAGVAGLAAFEAARRFLKSALTLSANAGETACAWARTYAICRPASQISSARASATAARKIVVNVAAVIAGPWRLALCENGRPFYASAPLATLRRPTACLRPQTTA